MNTKHLLKFFVALFIFMLSLPVSAQGMILPPVGVVTDPASLKIDYHRVNVEINQQIANTLVEMQFTNQGEMLAEGTFVFPLPSGAAIDRLTMYVDGVAIDARILPAAEARHIYNEIVRSYRDPALLEYTGKDVVQANIFPIPPGESRKIEISYGQVLGIEQGMLHYTYPMNTAGSMARVIGEMSIAVNVTGSDRISTVYSPSHPIVISRPEMNAFSAGFEAQRFVPESDFSLFFAIARETIDLNLMTYRESAAGDGYFLMMVEPPVTVEEVDIQPRDIVIVLDQSGSMAGSAWDQAREAAKTVLRRLNPRDRFNVVVFSTGYRVYANSLLPASDAPGASDWITSLAAEGGTDINAALEAAVGFHQDRPLTILFLTDGLANQGITGTPDILANIERKAPADTRIFTFGVGYDVDTFLLDALAEKFRGTGVYVRPNQRIDEAVNNLYSKISTPVMTDVSLSIDGVMAELVYPVQMPDLFAGEQVTVVGRYRGSADDASIMLKGHVNGEERVTTYSGSFREFAGGESFIERLWATRRIGELLNTIRLHGEDPELIESVVALSIRYGIITPYTSFLIEEDDILSQQGRQAAVDSFAREAEMLADDFTGASAIDAADMTRGLRSAGAPMAAQPTQPMSQLAPDPAAEMEEAGWDAADGAVVHPIRTVQNKTFILQHGIWTDSTYEPDTMTPVEVVFLSDEYFDLLDANEHAAEYLAVGENVIVVLDGTAYRILPE